MNNQEQFWQGQFGDEYTERNVNYVENNYQLLQKIFCYPQDNTDMFFSSCEIQYEFKDIKSIIEFGAGSGQNILALQKIFPDILIDAVEINKNAILELCKIKKLGFIVNESILHYHSLNKYDLVLSKGLLIHIHPDNIEKALDVLYNASNKYILLCEYYSPERREILYRGEHDKLWTFDFIKSMLDRNCKLLDYGFVSKYDKYFQDDLTWALFEK